jgi:outer membrane protein W
MKKIILSALALFAFGFANAQDTKEATGGKGFTNGDVYVSGAVGFSSQKTGDFKNNSFTIAPSVGFFVTDNISIGGRIGYTSATGDQDVTGDGDIFEVKTSTIEVGAFGRYYTTPSSDFSFFGELGVAYMSQKSELTDVDGSDSTTNGFGIALSPGVSYFISSNFALEASIGALSYTSVKPDADGAESTNTFGLNVDLTNINLGLVYKF